MRKPTDKCLLCEVNDSRKTNSHIFPRFISTNFLGNPRRGYSVGGKTTVIQDSPKEDYILCPDCESYLSVIEGYCADDFKFWKEKVANGDFKQCNIEDDIDLVSFDSADPSIIRLLIYSMFWRASISGKDIFEGYSLEKSFQEKLRLLLLRYKSNNRNDLFNELKQNPVEIFPTAILTSENFTDETGGVLAAIGNANPYSLNVDRFGFLLYESQSCVTGQFKNFVNVNINDCMAIILPEKIWQSLMVIEPFRIINESNNTTK